MNAITNGVVRSNAIIGQIIYLDDEPIQLKPQTDLDQLEQEIGARIKIIEELADKLIRETSEVLWMTYYILENELFRPDFKTQKEYLEVKFLPVTGMGRSTAFKYLKVGRFAARHNITSAEDVVKIGGPPILNKYYKAVRTDNEGNVIGILGSDQIDTGQVRDKIIETLEDLKVNDLDLDWDLTVVESLGSVHDVRLEVEEGQLVWSARIIQDGTSYKKKGLWGPIPVDMPDEVRKYILDHGVNIKL